MNRRLFLRVLGVICGLAGTLGYVHQFYQFSLREPPEVRIQAPADGTLEPPVEPVAGRAVFVMLGILAAPLGAAAGFALGDLLDRVLSGRWRRPAPAESTPWVAPDPREIKADIAAPGFPAEPATPASPLPQPADPDALANTTWQTPSPEEVRRLIEGGLHDSSDLASHPPPARGEPDDR